MRGVTIEEAREFHRTCPVIDAHCDTLLMVGGERRLGERFHEGLFQRGHPPEVVRAVPGGNFLRIMEEVGIA